MSIILTGIEDIELYKRARKEMMRQYGKQYLEDDVNFNLGFNIAWRFMQGAAKENAAYNVASSTKDKYIETLQVELASMRTEIQELQDKLAIRVLMQEKLGHLEPAAGLVEQPVKRRRGRSAGGADATTSAE